METATILFFSATASFLFLCVGIVAGWTAKDFMHDYFYTEEEQLELLSVKFIDEDYDDETFD